MERDQEDLQSFGFFATLKESFKIIFSWKKIFSQIALSLVLPLAFVYLIQFQVTDHLYWKLRHDEREQRRAENSTNYYNDYSYGYDHWSEMVRSDKIALTLTKVAYYVATIILSLLATAGIVYTIASIYTNKPVAYKKVMSVVPKVWKRLMVTFLWSFGIVFVVHLLSFALFYLWAVNLGFGGAFGIVVFVSLLVSYLVVYIYIGTVWRVACVVTVMEEDYGIKALFKGKDLIKGKTWISTGLIFLVFVFHVGIVITYGMFGMYFYWSGYMVIAIPVSVACWLLLTFVMLVDFVLQTVIYFVCKSYHSESIDRPALADHIEAFNAQFEVTKSERNVQMEPQVMV